MKLIALIGNNTIRFDPEEGTTMAKFEVEYASFTKVKIEAEDQEEAELIASIMEDEEIEEKGCCEGYVIWNEPVEVKG